MVKVNGQPAWMNLKQVGEPVKFQSNDQIEILTNINREIDIKSIKVSKITPYIPIYEIGLSQEELPKSKVINLQPKRPDIPEQVSFEIQVTGYPHGHRPGVAAVKLVFES